MKFQKFIAMPRKFGSSQADAKPNQKERINISRRMREALIKASTVGGVAEGSSPFGEYDLDI